MAEIIEIEDDEIQCISQIYKCKICNFEFDSTSGLEIHYIEIHFKERFLKLAEIFFPSHWKCSRCGETEIKSCKEALMHLAKSHGKLDEYLQKYQQERAQELLEICSVCRNPSQNLLCVDSQLYCVLCATNLGRQKDTLKKVVECRSKKVSVLLNRQVVNDYLVKNQPRICLERCEIPLEIVEDDKSEIEEVLSEENDDDIVQINIISSSGQDNSPLFVHEEENLNKIKTEENLDCDQVTSASAEIEVKRSLENNEDDFKLIKGWSEESENKAEERVENQEEIQEEKIQQETVKEPQKIVEAEKTQIKEVSQIKDEPENVKIPEIKEDNIELTPNSSEKLKNSVILENSEKGKILHENIGSTEILEIPFNQEKTEISVQEKTEIPVNQVNSEILVNQENAEISKSNEHPENSKLPENQSNPLNPKHEENTAAPKISESDKISETLEKEHSQGTAETIKNNENQENPIDKNNDQENPIDTLEKLEVGENLDSLEAAEIMEAITEPQNIDENPPEPETPEVISEPPENIQGKHLCQICQKYIGDITQPVSLELHWILVHFREELSKRYNSEKCEICSKPLNNLDTALLHYGLGCDKEYLKVLQVKACKNSEQCPFQTCELFFPNAESVLNHISLTHKTDCRKCKMDVYGDFQNHLNIHYREHLKNLIGTNATSNFACGRCPGLKIEKLDDLVDHSLKEHNVAKLLYERDFPEEKPQDILSMIIPEVKQEEIQEPEEKEEEMRELYFECACCKNKGKPNEFASLEELRCHLAINHFNNFFANQVRENLKKYPLCPHQNCEFLSKEANKVYAHFHMAHKGFHFDSSKLENKCADCYLGPFNDFSDLLSHIGMAHGEKVDDWAKRLGMQKTLAQKERVKVIKVLVKPNAMSIKEKAIKSALSYHSPSLKPTVKKEKIQQETQVVQSRFSHLNNKKNIQLSNPTVQTSTPINQLSNMVNRATNLNSNVQIATNGQNGQVSTQKMTAVPIPNNFKPGNQIMAAFSQIGSAKTPDQPNKVAIAPRQVEPLNKKNKPSKVVHIQNQMDQFQTIRPFQTPYPKNYAQNPKIQASNQKIQALDQKIQTSNQTLLAAKQLAELRNTPYSLGNQNFQTQNQPFQGSNQTIQTQNPTFQGQNQSFQTQNQSLEALTQMAQGTNQLIRPLGQNLPHVVGSLNQILQDSQQPSKSFVVQPSSTAKVLQISREEFQKLQQGSGSQKMVYLGYNPPNQPIATFNQQNGDKKSTSLLKNYRKKQKLEPKKEEEMKITGELRAPNLQERNAFLATIFRDPQCQLCSEILWEKNDQIKNRSHSLNKITKHFIKSHLYEETKHLLLKEQLEFGKKSLLSCPFEHCFKGQNSNFTNYSAILEHYQIEHFTSKSVNAVWQLKHFGTCSERKELYEGQHTDGEIFSDALAPNSMKLAEKLCKIGLDKTVIQPTSCFLLGSEQLEYCHECTKRKLHQAEKHSICQFEGFRKIKRIPSDNNTPYAFEANGFLDPFSDPTETDKKLWTSPKKRDLDVERAKMIILRAGDEFCNMAKQELDVISEYKTKLQDEKCVIWKRLQYKVREMCDVCSTSLFNAHFTCTECGIIVCIDCHQVRLKGNLAYQGSSVTYKSKKRRFNTNFDTHYWPFCKEKGREHQPAKLILTQIICGDFLKEMNEKVHKIKAKFNMSLDCNCCKKAEVTEIPTSEPQKPETQPEKPKENQVKSDENKFIENLKECPICKNPLNQDKPLSPGVHLIQHFHKELSEKLPKNPPFKCGACEDHKSPDLFSLMLHVGLAHGEFEKMLVNRQKKLLSLKNIILKVDVEKCCKVCDMDYSRHLMTSKTQIRTHLMTHFRDDLLKMVQKEGNGYKCSKCDFKSSEKRKFADHLGIWHRMLDTLVEEYKKPEQDTEKPTKKEETAMPESPVSKKKISMSDYKKFKKPVEKRSAEEPQIPKPPPPPSISKPKMLKCEICDLTGEVPVIRRHLVDHYREELKEMIKLDVDNDKPCPKCPGNFDLEHLALEHHFLDMIMQEPELKHQKQEDFRQNQRKLKRTSSNFDSSKPSKRSLKYFKCKLCTKELQNGDHKVAIDHFSTHIWLKMQTVKPSKIIEEQKSLFNALISSIPLDDWLIFNNLQPLENDTMEIYEDMKKRVNDIIEGKWCCFCTETDTKNCKKEDCKDQDQSQYFERKLCSTEDIENLRSIISPTKNTVKTHEKKMKYCEWCVEGYQKDYIEHCALTHFRNLFEEIIIPDFLQDLRCTLCEKDLSYMDKKDQILHLADKHKLLERYIYLIKNDGKKNNEQVQDIFDKLIQIQNVTSDKKLYTCKKCDTKFYDIQSLRVHVIGHFKESWPLPKIRPYICPKCFYEAATYLSLFKHVGTKHGDADLKKAYASSVIESHSIVQSAEKKPIVQKATYEKPSKKEFKIELPRPKIKFVDFLKSTLKGAQAQEEKIQESEEPQTKLLKNEHPPHQINCSMMANLDKSAPHRWLCDGRLLLLENPKNENNINMFQEQWIRGQPVLICNSSELLNQYLWHPEAFRKDFGHLHHDLVNCLTGKVVPKASLDKFWSGFQYIEHRLKDQNDTPMLLKLKDWPPTEDIAKYMPKRFKDVLDAYPLHEYTHREGDYNLAGYLPDHCLKPELGPKMYIAYGSALYSEKGSTNLHIDMSDAVNCLVYVGFPKDGNMEENAKQVFKEVDKAGCDVVMKRRIRDKKILPGALWHIFHPSDTVKIRDFLNKVALEKGVRLDPHDDPIHDQSTYLDETLRRRLYQEYGVKGYAIVQCAGDTVFIPAGAAHQVRNLHNCIKIAEDFVSPENISHCLHLTQEFRHLTEWHTNHEDKLQIKTILYHAIKTAVAVLEDQ